MARDSITSLRLDNIFVALSQTRVSLVFRLRLSRRRKTWNIVRRIRFSSKSRPGSGVCWL
jgi:hypothetical protein